ncbi:kinesin family protein [Ceratocystis lukuohia]|uniref:Kinesin-like protein n=1 Tax=Ceratocystis lukuohia TaxID=2019550 RepID=A0ABR4MAX1_9PEZI
MTTLPRPARPTLCPPTGSLPAIPMPKTRKSTIGLSSAAAAAASGPTTPRSGLRTPSSSLHSPTRSNAGVNAAPLVATTVPTASPPSPLFASELSKRNSTRKSKTSMGSPLSSSLGFSSTISEGKSIPTTGNRTSDGFISVSSPPHSRTSSAQDSYSTSATTYDDPTDISQNTQDTMASVSTGGKKSDGKGNVIVSVRVRPTGNSPDRNDGEWLVDGRSSTISYNGKEAGDYTYDNVFSTHDNNSRVYDHCAKRLVRRVMEGYHGTVFAYGMTGTGKTFSMQGTASSPGVIPLAITDIFSYIRETPSREFLLRVSYLEIYNERIQDLLSMPTASGPGGAGQQEEIKLREDAKRGVYATPLKEEIVQSPTQLLRVIARGDQARRTASTQFNSRSSRSHAVVQIVVESRERVPGGIETGSKRSGLLPGGVRVSTLSLIDLAGSEKAAESKERRQEGSHINKSLLTLGTVISKLSEQREGKGSDKEGKHLPYRDSKLTRLLQGALSGNSLVSILCTIQTGVANATAHATHITETLNTLKFASRARNSIVSHAKRAEEALGAGGEGGARVLLERYRMEIQDLRSQLETQQKNGGKSGSSSDKSELDLQRDAEEERLRELQAESRHEEQMLEMQLARTALKERIDHLNKLILSSKSIGVNTSGSYSSLGMRFSTMSQVSIRSSVTPSIASRSMNDRTSSMTSTSTIGRRSSAGNNRLSGGDVLPTTEDDESFGEFGDGTASMAAQNRALQADLVDKNRYIATLEKRLIQARRASSSRASVGLSTPNKGIMVGEDHSVAALLKEKDSEIAELRARLDDKDRMLSALRSATRSREAAESSFEARSPQSERLSGSSNFFSTQAPSPAPTMMIAAPKRLNKTTDDIRILDEMISDRIDSGHIVRNARGSVRVNDRSLRNARSQSSRERALPPSQEPSPTRMVASETLADLPETTKPVAIEI